MISLSKSLVLRTSLSLAVLFALAQAGFAQQDTLSVKADKVGVRTDDPLAPVHVFGGDTEDIYMGVGPDPGAGPAFNIGYSGASFGRSSGFFNVRPDASATAPNPSLRFMTKNELRLIIDNQGYIGLHLGSGAPTNFDPQYPIHAEDSGAHLTVGGVWTNASSLQLKENVEELDLGAALETLQGLTPVGYNYKADPTDQHLGFIAEHVPDAVATPDRKGLAAMDIVAVLTRVVQAQQQQIDGLQRRLSGLERAAKELD